MKSLPLNIQFGSVNKNFLLKISFLFALLFSYSFYSYAQVKKVRHVIFIGVDGMGAYAANRAENTTMQMMMKQGAYSLKALSCLPSSSAPNWASHFMGSAPEQHGYNRWNSRTPAFVSTALNEYGMYPTIFYAIKKQKPHLKTAAVYEWEGIPFLFETACVDKQAKGDGDVETTNKAIETILTDKPNFLFVHLNGPDSAGHTVGFNSEEFYKKVKNADGYILNIINATKKAGTYKNTVFIVSADHGGKGKEHGEDSQLEREIPYIIFGKPVRHKGEMNSKIMPYDTAPTIGYLLGVKPLEEWIGKAINKPF